MLSEAERESCHYPDEPRFNPFQGIQVLSVDGLGIRNRFLFVSIPFREFKCCRSVGSGCGFITLIRALFQSLSGNSSVVGDMALPTACDLECFNPFQGIQVLSVPDVTFRMPSPFLVSIPFREFKCCRFPVEDSHIFQHGPVSIPFREFKCCRKWVSKQGKKRFAVSIPFREFKCCREMIGFESEISRAGFNPFQGIQVLSGTSLATSPANAISFQSLSGNSSVVGGRWEHFQDRHNRGFNPFQGIQVLSAM